MKISVFGTGYVGLVTGVCFAEMGNDVICVDIDPYKISQLKECKSPIYEPGLEGLISANVKAKRINFTTDSRQAVEESDILFIAVGTPSDVNGAADLQFVMDVAKAIAENINKYKLIVVKSTVPVGSCAQVRQTIQSHMNRHSRNHSFDVVFNPEFLREGCAIDDCLRPSRVVVGSDNEKAIELMEQLYEPFLKGGNPFIAMDTFSAEMTKYAANAMLATKLTLMNEISRLCEKTGADIESVRKGIGTDSRIGSQFIFAGVGYGGSCFPKDVKALIKAGMENKESLEILEAVERANWLQRENFFSKIKGIMGNLQGAKIAIWGVAFKPGTDDIRYAPSLDLIQKILDHGGRISVYDPVAAANTKKHFRNSKEIQFVEEQYEAIEGADGLVIVTEWKSFKEPNFGRIKSLLKKPLIFDGRNLYSLKVMKQEGLEYHSIGRPAVRL